MRLIDVSKLLYRVAVDDNDRQIFYVSAEEIDNAPTIDAEPVRHGHWVACTLLREMGAINGLKCSICGNEKAGRYVKYNYCPHCGAKMDEVSE